MSQKCLADGDLESPGCRRIAFIDWGSDRSCFKKSTHAHDMCFRNLHE